MLKSKSIFFSFLSFHFLFLSSHGLLYDRAVPLLPRDKQILQECIASSNCTLFRPETRTHVYNNNNNNQFTKIILYYVYSLLASQSFFSFSFSFSFFFYININININIKLKLMIMNMIMNRITLQIHGFISIILPIFNTTTVSEAILWNPT